MPVTRTNNGPRIVAEIQARAGEAAKVVARRILDHATAIVPIDTGELRDSGHVIEDPNGRTAYVVYDAAHSSAVHDGTASMQARPWLARAVLFEKADALATFRAIVRA